MNLSMSLRTAAIRLPNHPAITAGETTQSYGVLEDRVGKLAADLKSQLNLAPGSRIGLAMENCADYLMILYGIWRAGLVAVPMNAKLHAKEMEFILCNSGCKLCFATPDIAERRLNVEPIVGHNDGAPGRAILLAAAGRRASLLTSGPCGEDIAA